MNIELKPRYWVILCDGIEQCFIPIEFAKNEAEAEEHYRNVVLNQGERERHKKFEYTVKTSIATWGVSTSR